MAISQDPSSSLALNTIDANTMTFRSETWDQSDLIHFLYTRLQPSLSFPPPPLKQHPEGDLFRLVAKQYIRQTEILTGNVEDLNN